MIHEKDFNKSLGELIGRLFNSELAKLDDRFSLIGKNISHIVDELEALKARETVEPVALDQFKLHVAKDISGTHAILEGLGAEIETMPERVAEIVTAKIAADLRERNLDFNERALKLFNEMEVRLGELHNGVDGAPGFDGKDGKDGVDGRDGVDGLKGDPGEPGQPGRDGVDGVSPDPSAIVAEAVEKTLAEISSSLDGALVGFRLDAEHALVAANERMTSLRDGIDGKDGRDGVDGKDGATPDIAPVVKELTEQVADRLARTEAALIEFKTDATRALVALDERTAAIRDGVDGKDGATPDLEPIAAELYELVGVKVREAETALFEFQTETGKVLAKLDERMAAIKDGRDGKDADPIDIAVMAEDVAETVRMEVAETFTKSLDDFTTRAGAIIASFNEKLAAIHDGKDGVDGKDGAPGKDADPEPIIKAVTEKALDTIEARMQEIVRGQKAIEIASKGEIEAMVAAAVAAAIPKDFNKLAERQMQALHHLEMRLAEMHGGEKGDPGRDGKDGRDGMPGERGEKGEKGDPGTVGVGLKGDPGDKGERGLDGKDGEPGRDGGEWTHRGTYDASGEAKYRRLDVVALDGGSFVAVRDEPGPCPGEGWKLLAGRGRAGQRGETGPRGMKGEKGEKGVGIADVVEEKGQVYFLLDDGRTIVIPWSRRS